MVIPQLNITKTSLLDHINHNNFYTIYNYGVPWVSTDSFSEHPHNVSSTSEKKPLLVCQLLLADLYKSRSHTRYGSIAYVQEDVGNGTGLLSTSLLALHRLGGRSDYSS